jgi:hypothetical protein
MIALKHHEIALPPARSFTWDAKSLRSITSWRMQVAGATLHEFQQAVSGLSLDNTFLDNYSHGDIKIPSLERLAGRIKHELQHGSGVVWLKPICNSEFNTAQKKFFYLAIGEAMGSTMGNYGRLYDVRDRGGSYKKQPIPVSQTHATTGFHTDSSALNTMPDIVALLCLRPAHTGGASLIVSAARIHEELRKNDLDTLKILYREFIRDVVTPGSCKSESPLTNNRFPIFSRGLYSPGVSFRYMRYWIEKGHLEANIRLTEKEISALNTLDEVLNLPRLAVKFKLAAGDHLWVNNHLVAHNRTKYGEDPQRPRHFVRMWISTPSGSR